MRLLRCILNENRCYKAGRMIKPKGIMVHSTGANNPYLKRYVQPALDGSAVFSSHICMPGPVELTKLLGVNRYQNDWNRSSPNLSACVHAFIGRLDDGSVAAIQTLPWDLRGWHAGTGTSGKSANDTHISFEICEDGLLDSNYFNQTYRTAVELCAMLCIKFNLDPLADGVIICHQDGYKRGIASNHGDIYNWWPNFGHFMDEFRTDIVDEMERMKDDMVYYKYFSDIPEYYQPTIEKCMDAGALRGVDDSGMLDISEDMCRTLTVIDRMGGFSNAPTR